MLQPALEAGDELDATVVNMRFVKPLDQELILQLADEHELLVTVEENVIQGGAGSAVNEYLASRGVAQFIVNYGLPDRLIQHGSQQDMLNDAKLTKGRTIGIHPTISGGQDRERPMPGGKE